MKKLLSSMIALLRVLNLATTAFAAGSVTYEGSAKDFVFAPGSDKSPTDLFEDFKNVMPGDSLTEQITVKNKLTDDTEVKIYLRSLGEVGASTKDFLDQLTLTVSQDGTELFKTGDGVKADMTGGLTDWVLLGSFQAGEEVTLDLTLSVPITMGNEFAHAVGYIDWEFMVEEIPAPTPTPTPEPSDPPAPTPTASPAPVGPQETPKTGDDSPVLLYGALVLLCVAALIVLLSQRKKSKAD